jgi:hypothetical protein
MASKSGTGKLARVQATLARKRVQNREVTQRAVGAAVAVGTAGLLGFARGKLADEKTKEWNIPKTEIPWELAIGVVLGGAGLMGYGGSLAPSMVDAGQTSLALVAARYGQQAGEKSEEK